MLRQSRTRFSGYAAAAVVVAAALTAAGCGSSSSPGAGGAATPGSSSSSGPAAATTPSAASSGGGLGAQSVTDYLSYTGGKAGAANKSLAPVDIGYVNQQGGPVAIGLHATDGAETAVKYINAELGGVDGHPVRLVSCFIAAAEEEGTTCAQKFLADKSVHVVAMGGVAIGVQSFFSALGGALPVIDGVAATPIDAAQKNAVILFGDSTHVLGPMGTYATTVLHAKTASVIYPADNADIPGALAIQQGLKAAGVSVKMEGYPPTATDLTGVLTAAGAQTADMVIPYTDASGCVNIAKALTQLGITDTEKIVSAPLCLNGQVAAGLGGDFPKWTYSIASSLYGDPTDPGMPAYMKVTSTYTTPADAPDPWEIVNFGQLLTVDKIFNELGYANITSAKILAAAQAFKGPQALGAPALDCGKYPSAPAVCNDRAQFFEYLGKNGGGFKKVAGWLQPPS